MYFGANTTRANFELRLYEGQNRFDLVYGEVAQTGSSATVGVQQGTGAQFTQFECNTAGTRKQRFATGFHRAAVRNTNATHADANVPTDLVGRSQRAESCGARSWRLFPG